jgi:hypothetical protein
MWAKFGQKVGSMFMGKTPKNKMTIAKFKISRKIDKGMDVMKRNPNKSVLAGAGAFAGLGVMIDGQSRQNMKIEMQKISKEKSAGKKFSRQEIKQRLDKAKKSKREFTWI